jgi:hypothetical protein
MKPTLSFFAAAASFVVLTIAIPPAEAQTRCARPHLTPVETVACTKARESVDELRRYAWRTRMIHNLYLPQYMPSQATLAIAQAQHREAPKPERDDVARVSR